LSGIKLFEEEEKHDLLLPNLGVKSKKELLESDEEVVPGGKKGEYIQEL
jgi:hypothetical protein